MSISKNPTTKTTEIPIWTDYFLGLAFAVSQRSKDPNTKHGTILVNPANNHVVGMGYNGYPRGMNDSDLPKTRPEKYKWFVHSEINAVSNCSVNPWQLAHGLTAYVTGKCCNNCLIHLVQNNVRTIYMAKRKGTLLETEETERDFHRIIRETGIFVEFLDIHIDWLRNICY